MKIDQRNFTLSYKKEEPNIMICDGEVARYIIDLDTTDFQKFVEHLVREVKTVVIHGKEIEYNSAVSYGSWLKESSEKKIVFVFEQFMTTIYEHQAANIINRSETISKLK